MRNHEIDDFWRYIPCCCKKISLIFAVFVVYNDNHPALAHIFIAPMRIGTGLQNKLLEAMALGIPCITTTLANNALGAVNGESICIADTLEETKTAVNRLLSDKDFAHQIAQNGQDLVRQTFNWEHSTSQLIQAIKATLK